MWVMASNSRDEGSRLRSGGSKWASEHVTTTSFLNWMEVNLFIKEQLHFRTSLSRCNFAVISSFPYFTFSASSL
jgi:hypothetical protein